MWQILNKYGIPEAFYGDNRTIFEFRRLSEKNQTIDRDVHINFKRMCMQLGSSSSPPPSPRPREG
jgi:hypothetical protein